MPSPAPPTSLNPDVLADIDAFLTLAYLFHLLFDLLIHPPLGSATLCSGVILLNPASTHLPNTRPPSPSLPWPTL